MTRLAFAPVIPLSALTVLIVLALLVTLYGFATRARGAWARGLAFTVLLIALAGPMLVKEKHAPLSDVAVIVTDRSQSMALGKRTAQAESGRTGANASLVMAGRSAHCPAAGAARGHAPHRLYSFR